MELTDPAAWGPALHPLTLVLVALDAPIPPIPSELFVIASGSLSADGEASLLLALLTAAVGCWLGDVGLYLLFRYRLTAWLDRFRWGRAVHRGVLRLLNRAGPSPTFAGIVALRFISGGRTASMAAAGLAGVPLRPFLGFSALGAALWACWMVGLGYAAGTTSDLPLWAGSLLGMVAGTLVGLIIAGGLAFRRRKQSIPRGNPGGERHEPADLSRTAPVRGHR